MTPSKKNPKLIAVTGGIGSGKSAVLNAIGKSGYSVISCDAVAAMQYKKLSFRRSVKKVFPTAFKGPLCKIDKAELASAAFLDDEGYKKLVDNVTLPLYQTVMKKVRKMKSPVFVEVPLLFELEKQNDFDRVIVVKRDKETRTQSVQARSGLKKSEIAARMDRQIDYDNFDFSPYRVINNDKDVATLESAAASLAKAIEKEFAAKS